MKRVISFLLSVLLLTGVLAVPAAAAKTQYKVKSVVDYVDNMPMFEYKYTYNNKGLVSKLEVISGEGAATQVTEYAYDKQGNLSDVLLYYVDYDYTTKKNFEYGYISYSYFNSYDGKNRLSMQLMDAHTLQQRGDETDGRNLVSRTETMYQYDTSGKLTNKSVFYRTNKDSIITEYTYLPGKVWTEVEISETKNESREKRSSVIMGRWNGPMILTIDGEGTMVLSHNDLPFTEVKTSGAITYFDTKQRLTKLEVPSTYDIGIKISY